MTRYMTSLFVLFSWTVCSESGWCEEASGAETRQLESVEVTASPIIEGNVVDSYAGQRTVISEDQFRDLNAQDLASAVRQAPGVSISRFNPVGSFGGGDGGAVFVRGMGSSRPGAEVQTLIDGVPMYNSVWNHPLLDVLPIQPAGSIEIYKGPQPAQFGNGFSAINIVPKRRTEPGIETQLSAAGGTIPTAHQSLEQGGRFDSFDYYIGQGFHTSDGHRENSDGSLTDYFGRFAYHPAEEWELSLFSLFTDNYSDDPGRSAEPESQQGRYATDAALNIVTAAHENEAATGSVKLYWNTGHGDWFDQAGADDDTLNDWDLYGVRVRESVKPWEGGEITAGIDQDYIKGETYFSKDDGATSSFESPIFRITSPYVALNHQIGDRKEWYAIPSGGFRMYEHSDFDEEWAPHAGLVTGYQDTELHTAYARGVNYPGLNVVAFSEDVIPALGNSWQDLEAERADHYEIGVSHRFDAQLSADLTYFHQDGKDRYVIVPPPPPPPSFTNLEEFTIDGVESSVQFSPLEHVALFAGFTWLNTDPADIPYAPKWSVPVGVNYLIGDRYRLSVDAKYLHEYSTSAQLRSSGASNAQEVDGAFLLNSKLAYVLNPDQDGVGGEVFAALENILDTDYEYQVGYPMPGINGTVGVRLVF